MPVKGVVDQRVKLNFNGSADPIDQTAEFTVVPLVAPPPPIWLIIPIGLVFAGVIYLAIRK